MTLVLAFLSWVGNVYNLGMENLLCADGIRWATANIVTNFTSAPLAEVILLMTGTGVIAESGILTSFFHRSSLKQKRALLFTLTLLTLFCLLVLGLITLPGAILLNAFGTLQDSPFSKSIPGLLFVLALIAGNGYGYTSGRFTTMHDVIAAHTTLSKAASGYFLTMFASAQLIGCAEYTHVLSLFGNDEAFALNVLSFILYYVTLILYIWNAYIQKR
ncbi:MAG: AbgT family transporter [Bacteroides sp.]|nr:AbgT family transporter [Roseburia sp.]MCM1346627.1 AbgT family transporter [Bacteroides sp.]MCM1421181.1 AbgT family transporter [Bacteroides sp.]